MFRLINICSKHFSWNTGVGGNFNSHCLVAFSFCLLFNVKFFIWHSINSCFGGDMSDKFPTYFLAALNLLLSFLLPNVRILFLLFALVLFTFCTPFLFQRCVLLMYYFYRSFLQGVLLLRILVERYTDFSVTLLCWVWVWVGLFQAIYRDKGSIVAHSNWFIIKFR